MTQPLPDSAEAAEAADPDELTPTRYALERGLLVIGDRTELVLVRHAQQVRTRDEAYKPGGPSLSELGRHQALLTGEALGRDGGVTAVYCSDLNRARQTAEVIAGLVSPGTQPTADPVLREVDMYGRDAGTARITTGMQEHAGAEFRRSLRFDAFPDTESSIQLRTRIHGALSDIVAKHPGERVVVVSHAGAICAFVSHVIGAGPDMFYFSGHAGVTRVFHGDGRFVPNTMNEVAHLRGHGALTY